MPTVLMNGPLAQRVVGQVRNDILAGHYEPYERLGSERVLCEKYEVSRPTLRAALAQLVQEGLVVKHQNRGTQVVAGARQRLQRLVKVKHRMIFLRMLNVYEVAEIVRGLQRFASNHPGVEALVIDVHESYEQCLDAITQFTSSNDGFFTRVYPYYEKALDSAVANGQSVVSWGRRNPSPNYSTIAADDFSAGYSATNHLISEHGIPVHYVGLDAPASPAYGRCRGWAAAMIDHGFPNYSPYFLRVDLTEDEAHAGHETFRQHEYTTMLKFFKAGSQDKYCIATIGDYTATSVYKAARDVGLEVGKQVFIVGFNNRPLCKRQDPPLSSVSYAAEAIGYEGAGILYGHMTKTLTRPLHKVLPVELIVRQSSTGVSEGGAE